MSGLMAAITDEPHCLVCGATPRQAALRDTGHFLMCVNKDRCLDRWQANDKARDAATRKAGL